MVAAISNEFGTFEEDDGFLRWLWEFARSAYDHESLALYGDRVNE